MILATGMVDGMESSFARLGGAARRLSVNNSSGRPDPRRSGRFSGSRRTVLEELFTCRLPHPTRSRQAEPDEAG